tara:strand:+ start:3048 stop:3260 length:213 start_codon:yes stop_codon:yes gene_type:complete
MITYWKKQNSGFVDSVDESTLAKHPEKMASLEEKGFMRIMGRDNWEPFKAASKAKAAINQVVKKVSKKKK